MLSLKINPFASGVRESATLSINCRALELRRGGAEIMHLGFGQSPFPVPEALQQSLREHADKKAYLPTQGLPELREAIADYYSREFGYAYSEKDVFVGPGSKELIFDIIYLTEGVLMFPAPSWVSYGPQAHLRGKATVSLQTQRSNAYKLEPEVLRQACLSLADTQKLLILNNPNNPTGAVYDESELAALADVCREFGVLVIADEIYAKISFSAVPHAGMAHFYPEGTIVTGGLSKLFAAGGYRLGLAMIPSSMEPLRVALRSLISETFSSVAAPIQHAAVEVYAHFDRFRSFVAKTTEIHHYVSRLLHRHFMEMRLNCPLPAGSFYMFPDFDYYREAFGRVGVRTGTDLARFMLENARVALLPGSDFYLSESHFGVRVATVDYDGESVLKAWPGAEAMHSGLEQIFFPELVKGCQRLKHCLSNLRHGSRVLEQVA